MRFNKGLFRRAALVRLDVGCGQTKQKGFIGIDRVRLPSTDIVHDITKFPWPVPSNVCSQIVMSHLWEHIEPKYRYRVMDELWRVCHWEGQLFIAAPYATSFLAFAHPEHYMCPNEATFQFFDPDYPLYQAGTYGTVKPWKIIRNDPNLTGCIEVILEPRKDKKGKAVWPRKK